MDADSREVLVAGHRAEYFIAEHWDRLHTVVPLKVREHLHELCEKLTHLVREQSTSHLNGQDAKAIRDQRRQELRDLVERARTAAVYSVSIGGVSAGIAKPLPKKIDDQNLIEAATGMALVLRETPAELLAVGLPESTPDELEAAADRLNEAIVQRTSHHVSRTAATDTIPLFAGRLRKYLDFIDRLITPALRNDPPLLRDWRDARRIADTRPSHARRLASGAADAKLLPSGDAASNEGDGQLAAPKQPKLLGESTDRSAASVQPITRRIAQWFRPDAQPGDSTGVERADGM